MPILINPLHQPACYRGWKIAVCEQGVVAIDPADRPVRGFPHWSEPAEIREFIDQRIANYN